MGASVGLFSLRRPSLSTAKSTSRQASKISKRGVGLAVRSIYISHRRYTSTPPPSAAQAFGAKQATPGPRSDGTGEAEA